ncbi:MAG: hypothetical protein Q9160_000206 [Pyrenula sp. 1 TL-2023]
MADRGVKRLTNSQDYLMALYFEMLFKKSRHDTSAVNHVLYILNQIKNLREETQQPREFTNLRVYCDDDDQKEDGTTRWTLVPDPPNPPPDYVPQRNRPHAKDVDEHYKDPVQEWEDQINQVRQTYRSPGCILYGVQAELYDTPMPGIITNQPTWRSTLTVCNYQLSGKYHSFDDVPQTDDISDLNNDNINEGEPGIDAFDVMTGLVLMHELTHMLPLDTKDMLSSDGEKAYAWERIVKLGPDPANTNADNFAYLALLAKLADRGFRLATNVQEAYNGNLLYEPGLIPPALPRRGRRRRRSLGFGGKRKLMR